MMVGSDPRPVAPNCDPDHPIQIGVTKQGEKTHAKDVRGGEDKENGDVGGDHSDERGMRERDIVVVAPFFPSRVGGGVQLVSCSR